MKLCLKGHTYTKEIQTYHNGTEKGMALACIQKLMEICSHPRILDSPTLDVKTLLNESPKLKVTIDILLEIQKRGEKAIVFTKFRKMQLILRLTVSAK